jgi:fructose-specific phosphotransferase system IIC component
MISDIILFSHPTLGVLGTMAALWVLVEALNASDGNRVRTVLAALAVTLLFILAAVAGGYWCVTYYGPEKAVILAGRGHSPTI